MSVEISVSEMSLDELSAERSKLLRSLKKMKRNPILYEAQLKSGRVRNLLLKDEICRRKQIAKAPVIKEPVLEAVPAMLMAA